MKERPILFSGEMVRAILEGRKTQTRRVIKPHPPLSEWGITKPWSVSAFQVGRLFCPGTTREYKCPYGEPGDRLWVRETWAYCSKCSHKQPEKPEGVIYKADGDGFSTCHVCDPKSMQPDYRWRPSIFMPRWASRITLEVKDVRVERVQDITESDAEAEGCTPWEYQHVDPGTGEHLGNELSYRLGFHYLWDSINAKRGYGWDTNPWVWVVEFEVMNE